MIIVSQDKTRAYNSDHIVEIGIDTLEHLFTIDARTVSMPSHVEGNILGYYSTREQATEVFEALCRGLARDVKMGIVPEDNGV